MRSVMVANPKGGCGKSTLSVHLASWFARHDEVVYLGDMDRQQSSRLWLEYRPHHLNKVHYWRVEEESFRLPEERGDVAILDTPAGLHGKDLKRLLAEVGRVIVPVSPSRFDMHASKDFFEELANTKAVRKERVSVAVVGMRIDPRTQSTADLIQFLKQFDLPLLTCIRNAQHYVRAVDTGMTLFDTSTIQPKDMEQWEPLINWLISRA